MKYLALNKFIATVGALSLVLLSVTAHASYSNIYAFGDSLSDVGNDLTITGGALPNSAIYTDGTTTGRFTNGQNYLDVLANSLGLAPLTASIVGGTDYAYGGARSASIPLPGGSSFNEQLSSFDSTHTSADPNALYVLWIGANDMTDAISKAATGDPGAITNTIGSAVSIAITAIAEAIGSLSGLGAHHFLIPNLPDLALVPGINGFNSPGLDALAMTASNFFNSALANTLNSVLFSALDIRSLDVYSALDAIVDDPLAYGFTNASDSCYTGEVDGTSLPGGPTPTICSNPAQYAFWDYEHPTAAVHQILGALAYRAVPEPSSLLLLSLGLLAAGFSVRKKSAVASR